MEIGPGLGTLVGLAGLRPIYARPVPEPSLACANPTKQGYRAWSEALTTGMPTAREPLLARYAPRVSAADHMLRSATVDAIGPQECAARD